MQHSTDLDLVAARSGGSAGDDDLESPVREEVNVC